LSKPVRPRGEAVRSYILATAEEPGLAQRASDKFEITRQAASLHIRKLIEEGAIVAHGQTRNRTYKLKNKQALKLSYDNVSGLAEDLVWRKDISEILGHLPKNVFDMWEFGFTEMFNNAIDHSSGATIKVTVWKSAIDTQIAIEDDGVGIFNKIRNAMKFEDARQAILELSKGKLTTDRANHSGEGIFFTSRMADQFDIVSNGVWYSHELGKPHDWVMEHVPVNGTRIYLRFNNHTSRTKSQIYEQFRVNSQYGFNRTIVPVRLAQYENDQLVSRSQAKRLLERIELFAEVWFDFTGVQEIGKAFADQIFRVFSNEHPNTVLHARHTNAEVQAVINEVLRSVRIDDKELAKIERQGTVILD
jgi:hypothetical protein